MKYDWFLIVAWFLQITSMIGVFPRSDIWISARVIFGFWCTTLVLISTHRKRFTNLKYKAVQRLRGVCGIEIEIETEFERFVARQSLDTRVEAIKYFIKHSPEKYEEHLRQKGIAL